MMHRSKRRSLESDGWKFGRPDELLGLSPEEASYIEVKVRLSRALRSMRQGRKLTQTEVARILQSSQSRVAKMEAGDPSVSLDLLIRSHFALGGTTEELAELIRS